MDHVGSAQMGPNPSSGTMRPSDRCEPRFRYRGQYFLADPIALRDAVGRTERVDDSPYGNPLD